MLVEDPFHVHALQMLNSQVFQRIMKMETLLGDCRVLRDPSQNISATGWSSLANASGSYMYMAICMTGQALPEIDPPKCSITVDLKALVPQFLSPSDEGFLFSGLHQAPSVKTEKKKNVT